MLMPAICMEGAIDGAGDMSGSKVAPSSPPGLPTVCMTIVDLPVMMYLQKIKLRVEMGLDLQGATG